MAILENGIETMELGATSWRVIINDNFSKIYTKTEVDETLKGYQKSTDIVEILKKYVEKTTLEKYAKKDDISQNLIVDNIDMAGILKYSSANILPTASLPQEPKGFIKIMINGEAVKVPYYPL